MIINLKIDINTLEIELNDSDFTINEIKRDGDKLIVEVSKPDPEPNTWQQ